MTHEVIDTKPTKAVPAMTLQLIDHERTASGVFDRTDELASAEHEQVVFCRDAATGLRAIISIHDTTLGPALGGTRYFPYESESAALTDGLRLSQGMTFKAAAAGMPLGGGKAVILGDPATGKTPALLRAYGRFIERLGGTYISAADVGTTSDDLDVVGETTKYVVGRNTSSGGSGDSGYSTAYGVFCSMRAAAEDLWGGAGLNGRTVGVEGAGKVGVHLIGLLLEAGAAVVVCDPYQPALDKVLALHPSVTIAPSVVDLNLDVYAPCALGATLNPGSVASLAVQLVCGAANNQLLHQGVGEALASREILWVPDFVANAGGLIQVGGELQNRTPDEVLLDIGKIGGTVTEILATARERTLTTGDAAAEIVQERLRIARA